MNAFLYEQIKDFFPYQPTYEQEIAIKKLSEYITSTKNDELFLLKGYAGTGKTSLMAAVIKALENLKIQSTLIAPTGRAAKVFGEYAQHKAFTIHKVIYRQQNFSYATDNYNLDNNLFKNRLFIVDEASMIANIGTSGSSFGGGHLLDDLIEYVYSGDGCKLIIMGDDAQLPPINENFSPALSKSKLEGYGFNVKSVELKEVVRQNTNSGILANATNIRKRISEVADFHMPELLLEGYEDVHDITGAELIEEMETCYSRDGIEDTIVICRSNNRANIYNKGIRNRILWREEELSSGDLVMVAKNNYHWVDKDKGIDFLANGEILRIIRLHGETNLYGFRFMDATVRFVDDPDMEIDVKIILDTLHSESPALSREQNEALFYAIAEDYQDITQERQRIKKIKEDPYYNALQIKYAYAITCHKAQGGQWDNVFIDQGFIDETSITSEHYRWMYTAFTRAKKNLFLVNYPKQTD